MFKWTDIDTGETHDLSDEFGGRAYGETDEELISRRRVAAGETVSGRLAALETLALALADGTQAEILAAKGALEVAKSGSLGVVKP